MRSLPSHIGLQVSGCHLGVHHSCRVAGLTCAEELMDKVLVAVLVNTTICKKNEGLYSFGFLEVVNLNIVFY